MNLTLPDLVSLAPVSAPSPTGAAGTRPENAGRGTGSGGSDSGNGVSLAADTRQPEGGVAGSGNEAGKGEKNFARVFADLCAGNPAAGADTSAVDGETLPAFKAVELSPVMQLITPAHTNPDDASLAAFAKAQGLDPAAVNYLLGLAQGTSHSTNGIDDTNSTNSTNGSASPMDILMVASGSENTDQTDSTAGELSPEDTEAALALAALLAPLLPNAVPVAAAPAAPPVAATEAGPEPALLAMLLNPQAIKAQSTGKPVVIEAPITPVSTEAAAEGEVVEEALDLEALVADLQHESLHKAKAGAIGQAAAKDWLLARGARVENDKIRTVIEGEVIAETLLENAEAPNTSGQTNTVQASSTSAQLLAQRLGIQDVAAASTARPSLTPLNPQSDQFQTLAQKMGEAVGQRILAQLERGQWQMRFTLNPRSLGKIDVDLQMRAGELQAQFNASHAVARDLLTEGVPRLRDVLTQSGMDVASISVGLGQGQRNGGNSTPGKQTAGTRSDGAGSETLAAVSGMTGLQRAAVVSADGLDVMV